MHPKVLDELAQRERAWAVDGDVAAVDPGLHVSAVRRGERFANGV